MSWTLAGAQHMVKVLQEQANGRLASWLGASSAPVLERSPMQPLSAADVLPQGELASVDDGWLAARIPMLTGPGRNQLSRALKRASTPEYLPFFWDRILDGPAKPAY